MTWKSRLRPFVPERLMRVRRRRVLRHYAAATRHLSLRERFTRTYALAEWGRSEQAYFSGPGSVAEASQVEELAVARLFERDPSLASIVDLGCGDFQVARRALARIPRPITYLGCDIVPELIAHNQAAFGSAGVSFTVCDITTGALPTADVVLCRQVLQHLSNEQVRRALEEITSACRYALLSNAVPGRPFEPNLDIPAGAHTRNAIDSGLVLEAPPFNLQPLQVYEHPLPDGERLRTLLVCCASR